MIGEFYSTSNAKYRIIVANNGSFLPVSQSPRIILFLDASRGFYRSMLSGIAHYSALNGRWTFFRKKPDYLISEETIDLKELKDWKPDGVICSITQAKELSQLNVPIVGYDPGNYKGRIPCILSDDRETGRLAAQHLLELGHRNFAFCGFNSLQWSRDRCRNFCSEVEKAGAKVCIFAGYGNTTTWLKEESSIREWIQSLPKPIGMFCCNDDRAASVVEDCLDLGYSVPEDISIIGADDDETICELANPPLSSVRLSAKKAGYEAARLMRLLILGKEKMKGQRIIAPSAGIAVRQSTNVLMVKNIEVRKALRFIRENMNRPIQVSDVVRVTGLCHRSLNNQFHSELGASISKHVTRARIEYISHLLTDTDMRIQEIAANVGYEDDRHFSRYFKRATGLTPKSFRRKMSPP